LFSTNPVSFQINDCPEWQKLTQKHDDIIIKTKEIKSHFESNLRGAQGMVKSANQLLKDLVGKDIFDA